SIELAVLLLVSSVRTDFTSFHLHHYLDHSVSPCDNLYRHVCPRGISETAMDMPERFYEQLTEQADSRSNNYPIMNDIHLAEDSMNCFFDPISYRRSLQKKTSMIFLHCSQQISKQGKIS
ncbi:hypothetical protein PMAYCL1PPCAC_24721, partial [Pristionchus mayeri]